MTTIKNMMLTVMLGMALQGFAQGKGNLQAGKTRNVFVELGYQPDEVDAKLKEVFNDVFRGPNKVYFEVGDSLGYVSDIKNNDARTEGMSYGMMIAVQMGEKDIFDRLWRWSKKYMQHQDGDRKGYFAWSCKTDGTHNAEGAASDGELYYITALLFASNRWGNNTGINYKAEAQYILNCIQPREYSTKIYLIDPETGLITFTPDGFGQRFTDPSYHIPAFYEIWARWADDGRSAYWMECAEKSRAFMHKVIHEKTGLNPDLCHFDGTMMPSFGDRRNGGTNFRYDSWRVPMNMALDYEWSGKDAEWQQQYGEKIQNFFYSQGIDTFVDQYRVDGTLPEGLEILQAGGFRKLRHSIGLVSTLAAASVMCSHDKRKEFVDALWNAKHVPFDDGYFDAYYDGLLRLFAFMHLSGNYRMIAPKSAPQLEFAMQLKVTLGETFGINNTQHGRRAVIPITGGTFEGPRLKGTIVNGGADYQLNAADGRTELEAIYCIKTDDGIYIHVRNRGIIYNGKDADGKPSFYFKAAPQFEAPADSKYGWLNNALFICEPTWSENFKGIVLNVWKVK